MTVPSFEYFSASYDICSSVEVSPPQELTLEILQEAIKTVRAMPAPQPTEPPAYANFLNRAEFFNRADGIISRLGEACQ